MPKIVSLPIEYMETQSIYSEIAAQDFRTVLFCAPVSGNGVSTIAYATAQKAVSAGKRTLLLEFTTQNSFLHEQLSLPVRDWSPDQLPRADELTSYSSGGLTYLPAPKSKNFPVNSRQLNKLASALEFFRGSFDLVVIDAPPVCQPNLYGIPTQMLAPQVDGTFLVASANLTGQTQIRRAVDILTDQGTSFAGVLLNDQVYPSLYKEINRQFAKGGRLGQWLWSKVSKPLHAAPFMTDSF